MVGNDATTMPGCYGNRSDIQIKERIWMFDLVVRQIDVDRF